MADDLPSQFKRINELHDKLDAIKSKIAEEYEKAHEAGIIAKVLRRIVKLSRMSDDQREQFKKDEFLQRKYEAELDPATRAVLDELRAGRTFDEAAAKTGTSRRTVARRAKGVPKHERSGTEPAADSDAQRRDDCSTKENATPLQEAAAWRGDDPGPIPACLDRRRKSSVDGAS